MRQSTGKVHLANTDAKASEYVNSPHIFGAILEYRWSACGQIPRHITIDSAKVTCMACLKTLGQVPYDKVVRQAEWKVKNFIENKAAAASRGFARFCRAQEKENAPNN